MELVERLLGEEPLARRTLAATNGAARRVVRRLLDETDVAKVPVCEASVHRPTRSRVYVASFTGPAGGQVWKSTGLTDRNQALRVARRWAAQARIQRAAAGGNVAKPRLRAGRGVPGTGGLLTQREVAIVLKLSERAVREIEHRALQKLFNHPALRQAWRQYLAGELDEDRWNLTPEEITALFKLARTEQELRILEKVTQLGA